MDSDEASQNKQAAGESKKAGKRFMVIKVFVLVLVLAAAGTFGYISWRRSQVVIPTAINDEVKFVIFLPGDGSQAKADKKTVKFDSSQKILSFVLRTNQGVQLSVGEQASPEIFSDVPQTYTQLIDGSQEYGSFGSPSGEVYLTHPKNLNGGQSAIMNAKGTLMFIHPTNGQLSESQWKDLFSSLKTVQ